MSFLDVLQWIGESLDKPGAAARGLVSGDIGALANLIPFSDTMGLTDPRQRVSGRDLLGPKHWGLLGENQSGLDMGDVAGFGLEMLLDPLNFVPGYQLAKAGLGKAGAAMANRGIRAANREMLQESASNFARMGQEVGAHNAMSNAMRANKALPEELLPQATKVYHAAPRSTDMIKIGGKLDTRPRPQSAWGEPTLPRQYEFYNSPANAIEYQLYGPNIEFMELAGTPEEAMRAIQSQFIPPEWIDPNRTSYLNNPRVRLGDLENQILDLSQTESVDAILDWQKQFDHFAPGRIGYSPLIPTSSSQAQEGVVRAAQNLATEQARTQARELLGNTPFESGARRQPDYAARVYGQAAPLVRELNKLASPNGISGQSPAGALMSLLGIQERLDDILPAMQNELLSVPIRGSVRNQANIETQLLREARKNMGPFNPDVFNNPNNAPLMILADYFDEAGSPLGEVIRSGESLRSMGQAASSALDTQIVPARTAMQSFYAVPADPSRAISLSDVIDPAITRKAIDRKLEGSWKSEPFANTMQELVTEFANDGSTWDDLFRNAYDSSFSHTGTDLSNALPELGHELDIFKTRDLVNLTGDVQTYLPHVAPKLKQRPRWIAPAGQPLQQAPEVPRRMAMAMLGHNTLQGGTRR